jgi:hypothetical protein
MGTGVPQLGQMSDVVTTGGRYGIDRRKARPLPRASLLRRRGAGIVVGILERKEPAMTSTSLDSTLPRSTDESRGVRLAVRFDAAVTGAFGALLVIASPLLNGWLGIATPLLVALGVILVGYALVLEFVVARRPTPALVWEVIALNTLWVVASVVAVLTDALTLTTLGTVFVLAQAAAVALIADLQYLALRKA